MLKVACHGQGTPKPKPEKGRMPLTEEPCTDCNTSAERWERSCSMMLGEMLSLRAYWNKEFGAWDKFPVPSSLAKLARQAADELTQLANQLEKSK